MSFVAASSLVVITLFFSYWQKLGLGKEIAVAAARAVIQLIILGYVLEIVFGYGSPLFTRSCCSSWLLMRPTTYPKRGKRIAHALAISFVSITVGTIVTLLVLVLSQAIRIEKKLALGAGILPASIDTIRGSLKSRMIPMIAVAKALGVVSLPGMMTSLILAGVAPIEAIKYQIMVTFMLLSTTAISSFIACYVAYRSFFNERKQVIFLD
nr:ABC transporter permease [Arcanobacterium phocae]